MMSKRTTGFRIVDRRVTRIVPSYNLERCADLGVSADSRPVTGRAMVPWTPKNPMPPRETITKAKSVVMLLKKSPFPCFWLCSPIAHQSIRFFPVARAECPRHEASLLVIATSEAPPNISRDVELGLAHRIHTASYHNSCIVSPDFENAKYHAVNA